MPCGHDFTGDRTVSLLEEVLQPEFERIHLQAMGHHVDDPLDSPQHLEMAEPTKRSSKDLVCVDHVRIDPAVGNTIWPCS